MAKLLVDYVDALLRKGGLPKPPEENEIEGRLDDLITLYAYSPRFSAQPQCFLFQARCRGMLILACVLLNHV